MSSLKLSKSGRIVVESKHSSEDLSWRNMKELEQSPQLDAFVAREYPEQVGQLADPVSRRRFVQLMGASFAFAGLTQGCRWEEEKILPLSRRPDGYIPGVAKQYASAFELGGVASGLVVTCMEGRPIKIEGNPEHPYSGGTSTAIAQASILEMYDPDRSRSVSHQENGNAMPATQADLLTALRALSGKKVHVLSEASSSPTIEALRAKNPNLSWFEYESVSQDEQIKGNKMAFGRSMRTHYKLDRVRVLATFDSELFGAQPASLRNSADLATTRDPDSNKGMSRIYSIESNFTKTGGFADHRLPVRSELIKPILLGLENLIAKRQLSEVGNAAILKEAKVVDFITALAGDLTKNKGRSLVTVGSEQPAEVHAIAARINATLGANGNTVFYTPVAERLSHLDSLAALLKEMNTGKVENLLILGGNPVYDAPVDASFAAALAKVKTSYHLSTTHNETSKLSNWHINRAHYLESWGDSRSFDGTVSIVQPMIKPLYKGMSVIDLLKVLGGSKLEAISAEETVLSTHGFATIADKAWRRILHAGFISNTAVAPANVQFQSFNATPLTPGQQAGSRVSNGQLEVTFRDSATYDGRYANNGWLVETPDFITKMTWDNAALISPATAKDLGVSNGNIIEITVGKQSLKIVAHVTPGQALGSIGLPLGWGRKRAGYVGGHEDHGIDPIGFDTYALRTMAGFHMASGATIKTTGSSYALAETQDHFEMDEIGTEAVQKRADILIKNSTYATYKTEGKKIITKDAHLPIEKTLLKPIEAREINASLHDKHDYEGQHQWGMTIDLGKCTGCNSCMLACQSENNVPIVGKEEVINNREMHWIRIDRYFKGNPDNPKLVYQPVHCQQCENAPCELVCPVEATSHSSEGLNDMTYNRCVGTRYCANNCPYKVRRFNYRYWNKDFELARNKVRSLLSNPDVTVRSRGVMEKCTWCVQRIERTKITAKNNRRTIVDGEIQTACQQACPTQAITFGDLADKNSNVYKKQLLNRSYALLASLNNLPRNAYLARITNPNPALSKGQKAKG